MTDVTLPKLDWRVVFNRASPPGRKGWGRVRAAQLTDMGRAVSAAAPPVVLVGTEVRHPWERI